MTLATLHWVGELLLETVRRIDGVWHEPVTVSRGFLGVNSEFMGGTQPLTIDSGGHVTALAADDDAHLFLRRVAKDSNSWTEPLRIDDDEHRYRGHGASLITDQDDHPMIFWSAEGLQGTNIAYTTCR